MLRRLRRRREEERRAATLYTLIVARARMAIFYSVLGVADTVDGRFDMIALHVFLVLNRLKGAQGELARLSQGLYDVMFADMDRSLREMGATAEGTPHRIKDMVKAFFGRVAAYDDALAQADETVLADALRRNVYRGRPVDRAVLARLAGYVRRQAATLAAVPDEAFLAGHVPFGPIHGEEAGI